jgi:UrcA family protein
MTLQKPSKYRLLIPVAFFFLSAAGGLPAAAGEQFLNEGPDDHSITAKFGDLDLNTDAGRRELLDRLRKGADRVCRQSTLSYAHLGPRVHDSCYRRSLARAVDTLHHAQLSALFAATSHLNAR